jgi:hypothetical protein
MIVDKINGCLDDNVDDESDASYYKRGKQDNFEDDEDASTNVFVLPEFKKSGTSKKTESEMMDSMKKTTPAPKKKFFSKFQVERVVYWHEDI